MTDLDFTPGPWTIHEQGEANQYAILTPDGDWVLGLIHNGEALLPRQRANMRLVAASPQMYAALNVIKGAMAELEGCTQAVRAKVRARVHNDIKRWCTAALKLQD